MHFLKDNKNYVIRLIKGEEIVSQLTKFCESNNLSSGIFHGIGAVLSAELGFYILENKKYIFRLFETDHEIVSLTGNIALVDEKPFIHTHIVISNDKFECFGGHLKEGVIGATCEIYLTESEIGIERKFAEEIGLKLLNCPVKF